MHLIGAFNYPWKVSLEAYFMENQLCSFIENVRKWDRFQELVPEADVNPTAVPQAFQLLISNLKLQDC